MPSGQETARTLDLSTEPGMASYCGGHSPRLVTPVQCPALYGDSLGTRSGKQFGRLPALAHFAKGIFYPLVNKAEVGPGPACASGRRSSGVSRLPAPGSRRKPKQPAQDSGDRGGFVAASSKRGSDACSPELRLAGAVRICLQCPHGGGPRPRPGDAPPPGPARAGPLSGPRPGPRPSADAPLTGSAPRACPQAPAGPAPQPGGSRLPVAPGPARRVPWATVSRETGPRPRHRHPTDKELRVRQGRNDAH